MRNRVRAGVFFWALFLVFSLTPSEAEENLFRLGIGLEANMNTEYGCALGRSLMVDVQLFKYIIPGVALTISDDFKALTVVEPELFARWYGVPLKPGGGLYVQGDIGISLAMEQVGEFEPRFLGGITGGFRLPLHNGDYYIEPYFKAGYPFLWAVGSRIGCHF